MNNLKFRAWDKKQNKIIPAIHIFVNGPGVVWINKRDGLEDIDNLVSTSDFELMQFTGLKDDSGKEIFQDDIVEIQNKNETKTSYISRVEFSYDGAIVRAHPGHIKMGLGSNRRLSEFCDYGFGDKYDVSCKIIGNIHESPELLTND